MNYIGSKNKLSGFIKSNVESVVSTDLKETIFCDLFAGTGMVARNFKDSVKQIITNDVEYYSYVLCRNYIGNNRSLEPQPYIDTLNQLPGREGFIFENYSETGKAGRLYFSAENGRIIDAMRLQIEKWKNTKEINEDIYFFLLASLIESADKVANTAAVYGAFLKHIKPSASKRLEIVPAVFEETDNLHKIFQKDADQLIQEIEGDILYLDPPYNARQYGANYHMLNTIAKYDTFVPKGKTGLRDYYRSSYCRKAEAKRSFEHLFRKSNFRYIFLSYNNEGLVPEIELKRLMQQFGKYDLVTTDYQRFKADKTENRKHTASGTTEFLHILEKTH